MHRSALTSGVLIAAVVVAAQALLIPLFAAPAANLAPRDLPIAVAGPPALAARLAAAHPGAFAVETVADAAAADAAIRDRDVYGAVVTTPAGLEVHVASAAGPTVSALLTQAAAGLGGSGPGAAGGGPGATGDRSVPVRDIVPLDQDDPRGAGFGAAFLPMAITSLLAGVLVFLAVRRRAARVVALASYGVLAGLAAATVEQVWLGILPGGFPGVAAALGLFALAVAAAMTGLAAVLGRLGLGLGALVLFLVGNAVSGISASPELLPQPWGAVGQSLPIGAGGTLVRSMAYFDGAGAGPAVAVLAAYAVGGLLLVVLGRRGTTGRTEAAPVEAVPELVTAR